AGAERCARRAAGLGDLLGAHVRQRRRLQHVGVDAFVGETLNVDRQAGGPPGELADDLVELRLDLLDGALVLGVQSIQFGLAQLVAGRGLHVLVEQLAPAWPAPSAAGRWARATGDRARRGRPA